MSRASALAKRVDTLLKLYAPPLASVYKRLVTTVGGDPLTGRQGVTNVVDTLCVPQPTYARAMRRQVGGSDATAMVTADGTVRVGQGYEMTFSINAITEADLSNANVLLAFKDPTGFTEVYRIEDYEPIAMSGELVAWLVYAVSQKR